MTTSYKAFARVTVVLDVVVSADKTSDDSVDKVRTAAGAMAVEAATHALKAIELGEYGVVVANWPQAVVVDLSIVWSRDK